LQKSQIFTSADYTIIAEWQKQEIPLHIVTRSINEVFDRRAAYKGKTKPIKSIEYFSEAVEDNFADWLQSQIGK
jgi:hypothetical protein